MAKIKNYTTDIPSIRSISEIQGLLARAGASRVMFEYDDSGDVKALVFMLKVGGREMPFKLPAKPEAVYKIVFGDARNPFTQNQQRHDKWEKDRKNQSVDIAWRIVKDWIEAQFALIELEQAEAAEIFMPYLMVSTTKTLFEFHKEGGFNNMLPEGNHEK